MYVCIYVSIYVSRVLDRQLLNGSSHGHQNCRVCSRMRSHDSVIFSYFWNSYFPSYGELGSTDPSNNDNLNATAVCVCACACVCVHACVREVFAKYDNKISPRLIMIIIKTIILYFIQIRHTYEFPSTSTTSTIILCNGNSHLL